MPRSRKKKQQTHTVDPTRLDECNLTELIQTARRVGFPHVSRQMPREEIEALIMGETTHLEDPLEEVRGDLYAYLQGNSVMLSGLSCSAYCPTCPHDRVVDCYSRNHDMVTPPERNPLIR